MCNRTYVFLSASCAGLPVANMVMYYSGAPTVIKQTGIVENDWLAAYPSPTSKETLVQWNSWTPTSNACPFTVCSFNTIRNENE